MGKGGGEQARIISSHRAIPDGHGRVLVEVVSSKTNSNVGEEERQFLRLLAFCSAMSRWDSKPHVCHVSDLDTNLGLSTAVQGEHVNRLTLLAETHDDHFVLVNHLLYFEREDTKFIFSERQFSVIID